MPRLNGIEATRAIAQTHPGTAVLVLTMTETDDSLVAPQLTGREIEVLELLTRGQVRPPRAWRTA